MSFSELDVTRRIHKGKFSNQTDQLLDWAPIEKAIAQYYDLYRLPQAIGIAIHNVLLAGIWLGGLSDETLEDIANSNLNVMHFLGLNLKDDVSDHSVLSRVITQLTTARAWDGLLAISNQQIRAHGVMVT